MCECVCVCVCVCVHGVCEYECVCVRACTIKVLGKLHNVCMCGLPLHSILYREKNRLSLSLS